MPTKLCSVCKQPATYRGKCDEHRRKYERERSRRRRGTSGGVYQNKRYQIARRHQLYHHPLCQFEVAGGECGQLATEVHHIHHLQHGGDLYALENLASLCSHHHYEQHRIDARTGGGQG